ncbi:MAG: hypothetical protein WCC60_13680 [Ilumatobacteraceae bacterium]
MPIQRAEIKQIARAISDGWTGSELALKLNDHLGVSLADVMPPAETYPEGVVKVVCNLCARQPSLRAPLLWLMRDHGTSDMVTVAVELLTPSYFSPSGLPIDAMTLGPRSFIDRADLRQRLAAFEQPSLYTSRVAVIAGEQPGGKSYSWYFLQHLAAAWGVGNIQSLSLSKLSPLSPYHLVASALQLLHLEGVSLPPFIDTPQLAHVNPLEIAFQGALPQLEDRFWLVIDDLNDVAVDTIVKEMAYAMARAAEQLKSNLFVVLIGYNQPIMDELFSFAVRDSARFPDASEIAHHVTQLVNRGGVELVTSEEVLQRAEKLLLDLPQPSREQMLLMRNTIDLWVVEYTGRSGG